MNIRQTREMLASIKRNSSKRTRAHEVSTETKPLPPYVVAWLASKAAEEEAAKQLPAVSERDRQLAAAAAERQRRHMEFNARMKTQKEKS